MNYNEVCNEAWRSVPLADTCEELQWEKPTLFVWIWTKKRPSETVLVPCLCIEVQSGIYIALDGSGTHTYYAKKAYAPQMHEIARALPPTIFNGKYPKGLELSHCAGQLSNLYEKLQYGSMMRLFEEKVNNHHYVQAYALLYKKVRDAGFLEKEVKNEA